MRSVDGYAVTVGSAATTAGWFRTAGWRWFATGAFVVEQTTKKAPPWLWAAYGSGTADRFGGTDRSSTADWLRATDGSRLATNRSWFTANG